MGGKDRGEMLWWGNFLHNDGAVIQLFNRGCQNTEQSTSFDDEKKMWI